MMMEEIDYWANLFEKWLLEIEREGVSREHPAETGARLASRLLRLQKKIVNKK